MKKHKKKRKTPIPKGKRRKYQYRCIDGNWTYYPSAYCKYHQGVLTAGLMATHRCKQRNCRRLDETQKFE
ncbi:hypothetical protein [Emergencia sp. 1XD21-10]|uniref:hypothetical protein n=1 Tax=Emergencia sp. 1XD21-10 TaxID=2304569 RepID=UPI001379A968|nr:hypothetical protein [Emergencia sp. 1XD21-10]NCE98415.1 hypothetical protein [Emergencia sp. 1XD21-10]